MFEIQQDEDFWLHASAPDHAVYLYNRNKGPGPSRDKPEFAIGQGIKQPWNQKVVAILVDKIMEKQTAETWGTPEHSAEYYQEMIEERSKRLLGVWREGQAKVLQGGQMETPQEVENRLGQLRDARLRVVRHSTRRRHVSNNISRGCHGH